MTNADTISILRTSIDLIKKYGKDWFDDRDIPALELAIDSLEKQEWIPCNPLELPKDKKLWVTHDRWGCRYVGEVYWDMTEWSDDVSDVVAYMPYVEPEPYMEE